MSTGALDGRVALVTGGGQGIGKAIAAELARHGARVVIADSGAGSDGEGGDPGVARAAAAEIGTKALAFADSVASPSAARAAVELAVKRFGAIDIVVNSAAIHRDGWLFEGDAHDWEAVVRNNPSAAYFVLAAAAPAMQAQVRAGRGGGRSHWGRIVNIVSTAGLYGSAGQAAYASAAGGLVALTRVVALDMADAGVTANAVVPMAAGDGAPEADAGHVAAAVAYLCSDAAQAVTGQLFGVRGREVLLFGPSRPQAQIAPEEGAWGLDALARAVAGELAPAFASLDMDLESE